MAEAMETAIRNGLSLTARLEDGQELETPDQPEGTEGQNVTRYRLEGVEPATEPTDEERVLCPYDGIGFMKIEIDFIVS